ncbi:MAG: GTPase, partial [Melioribacteraceae bacterium]
RDIIREDLSIDGILFKLFDTAGIRATDDMIEKEGVIRSREAVKNADIVLFMDDITGGFSADLYEELIGITSKERIIRVFNKIDLEREDILEADVKISAKTGEGMNLLFAKLKEKAVGSQSYTEKTAIINNLRHYNALNSAREFLGNTRNAIKEGLTGEFIAADLHNAEAALSEIIGTVTSEEILNNIFAKFCIGK